MASRICALSLTSLPSARLIAPSLASSCSHARWKSRGASDCDQFLFTKPGVKAKVIDGKKIAEAVKAEVAEEVGRT